MPLKLCLSDLLQLDLNDLSYFLVVGNVIIDHAFVPSSCTMCFDLMPLALVQSYEDTEALKVLQKHVLADYQAHKVRRPIDALFLSNLVAKRAVSYVKIECDTFL